ncbi:MAG: hypothetical protein GXP49_16700, partial [Deltaproteobacteria bacterium]|nr:hypothetical protein [Deltaproteobacteria bacterium]
MKGGIAGSSLILPESSISPKILVFFLVLSLSFPAPADSSAKHGDRSDPAFSPGMLYRLSVHFVSGFPVDRARDEQPQKSFGTQLFRLSPFLSFERLKVKLSV